MKLRPALLRDVPTIALIGTLAFAGDPSYEHFFPRRSQYPDDFYAYLLHDYKRMLATPGQLIMVVELDELDEIDGQDTRQGERGRVVAYATFVRSGGTVEELARWNSDSIAKKLQRWLLHLERVYISIFTPNRAVSRAALDDFWTQAYAIHATTPFSGKLDFKTLAVLPGYQRQGFGEKLIEYGGYRAYEEGIPVFGDATSKGLQLYLRNGAREIGRIVLQEQVVERPGQSEPIKLPQLETPVLRWDAGWASKERIEKVAGSN
ncbi:hypothetical protein MMC07_005390 [Pseudocyphellaria aurata]|nr:hypothetical protein [Pseudocyphellaria aurata]